ncbi:hypothetical protein DEU56DRAFT_392100, partial [Suillus clintonianus]|uniref:uncharacterized protein n=1 Tax=Suillus clintonianus TaxID=1904413 RepID=UPI001B864B49
CLITGVRNKSENKTNYYVPLTPPTRPDAPNPHWDPLHLPLRSHAHFEHVLQEIDEAETAAEKERIGKKNGLRAGHLHLSDRWRVGSIDFAKSFPWEWMHVFLENIAPMLVKHWTGKFKGMDTGKEDYQIADHIWAEIGEETAAAVANIPAAFVRVLGNIADDHSSFTAESWSFWIIYLAPTLLRSRFPNAKYHKHLCELVWIMKKTLQFSITHAEIDELERRIANWVVKYEKYYYQHDESRLPACTLPVHGMLHIADDIRRCGPVWTTWTFFLERYCQKFKTALKSRVQPWGNLNKEVLYTAYLQQVVLRYDVQEEVSLSIRRDWSQLTTHETVIKDYNDYVLRPPRVMSYSPDHNERAKVALYIKQLIGGRHTVILANLPNVMALWKKVRIQNGGDSIRTHIANKRSTKQRTSSYVRYELEYEDHINGTLQVVRLVQYGRLEKILVCPLSNNTQWLGLAGKTLLLALIRPCQTGGRDATKEETRYSRNLASIITDLRNVKGVVGRVESRGEWTIIDRRSNFAKPAFDGAGYITDESEAE